MLTLSHSLSSSLGAYALPWELGTWNPIIMACLLMPRFPIYHRKQFSPSDFSRTLRELGLTPSAVSRAFISLILSSEVYNLCIVRGVFTIVGLDSIVREICYNFNCTFCSL